MYTTNCSLKVSPDLWANKSINWLFLISIFLYSTQFFNSLLCQSSFLLSRNPSAPIPTIVSVSWHHPQHSLWIFLLLQSFPPCKAICVHNFQYPPPILTIPILRPLIYHWRSTALILKLTKCVSCGHRPPKSLGWKCFCTFHSSLSLNCQHEINIHFVLTAALTPTSPSCSHFSCLSLGLQCFSSLYLIL